MNLNPLNLSVLISFSSTLLVACGPESNSRYGDEYWDPTDTKATFDPVEPPEYTVTYSDNTDADTADDDWTAHITIDFTDLNRRSKDGVIASYQRGFAEQKLIDDLIDTNVSTITDTEFVFDYSAGEDRRLSTDIPGEYAVVLDFDVIWPNGNTVSYLFNDMNFTIPGCQTNYGIYSDYINPVLADNCVNCHNAGDASSAFDLDSTNNTTRRTSFFNKVSADALSVGTGTMVDYIFGTQHTGTATANAIDSTQQTKFRQLITLLQAIDNDTGDSRNITSDFTFLASDGNELCFSRPSTMVVEE